MIICRVTACGMFFVSAFYSLELYSILVKSRGANVLFAFELDSVGTCRTYRDKTSGDIGVTSVIKKKKKNPHNRPPVKKK